MSRRTRLYLRREPTPQGKGRAEVQTKIAYVPQDATVRSRWDGLVVGYGAEETYFVANPRDYETHPLREGEIRNTSIFHRSMTEALFELSDPVRNTLCLWHGRDTSFDSLA